MSRRRQSWRPYVALEESALERCRYGRVQAVPLDTDDEDDDDDLAYTPQWWLAVIVAIALGVALCPLAAAGVWLAVYLAGVGR